MAHTDWFDQWFDTPYYHQLYFQRDDQEAAAFINRLIEHLQPSTKSCMLDVACGKGRHSLHLSEKGFDVTGIDLSVHSIAEANLSAHEGLQFFVHDMRQPFYKLRLFPHPQRTRCSHSYYCQIAEARWHFCDRLFECALCRRSF